MINVEKSEVVLWGPKGEALIEKTPGVCGGKACLGTTRIGVWLMIAYMKDGASDNDIFEGYPTVSPQDLAAAREYYRLHPEEIDEAIRKNELFEE
jgi:uncharacterized protein (DUF433 family)